MTLGEKRPLQGVVCVDFVPGQRFCVDCEVSATLATCWLCGGRTVAGQGPVPWNSSHTWTQRRTHTSLGGLIVPIEDEPVSII